MTIFLHRCIDKIKLYSLIVCTLFTLNVAAQAQPIKGFAELHSHLMAEHSFGGSWYWGNADGPMEWALRRCDGNPAQSHGAIAGLPGVAEFIASDTGIHLGKRRGYDRRKCRKVFGIKIPGTCPRPHFAHWPRHDGLAHQQMWHGHLRQAFNRGMKVMVVSLAESNFLCRNTPARKRKYGCDEMASVHRQIDKLNRFAYNHRSWLGIARSASDVRRLANQNKLALVISVEVSKLFPSGDIERQLDSLYAKGVRSMQLVHHHDNRFSGTAPIPRLIKTVRLAEAVKGEMSPIDDVSCGKDCDGNTHLNTRGLSRDGAILINAMMDRGMLVDVAHTSRKAFKESHAIMKSANNYPIFYSHAHLYDAIKSDEERNEKYIKRDEIELIKQSGGMVGLRTGLEAANTYSSIINNGCDGSVRSFAQSLMRGVDQGLNIGFGADLNGFITQMRPSCQPTTNSASRNLQAKGLAHIGVLPEIVSELQNIGVPNKYINHINNSAERFVTMWERAEGIASTR